jgi:HAMP domain
MARTALSKGKSTGRGAGRRTDGGTDGGTNGGDFSVRLPARRQDAIGGLEAAYNELAARNAALEAELVRVGQIIGREGRMTERARLQGAEGAWGRTVDSINGLIDDLVRPTTEVARVIVAVAEGDLSRRWRSRSEAGVKVGFARIGTTVNSMVDQLSSFADEVTRVAREVGTEGKLGGQAAVPGVAGTWKDLTDSVNFVASNLTVQVRNIADVTTAVADGDLQEDRRRRAWRDPRAQEHRQHDGRPAVGVRRRGDSSGTRGRHRGQARKSGRGCGGVGDVERPHRLGELHGIEPDFAGAQHRSGDHRRRPGCTTRQFHADP